MDSMDALCNAMLKLSLDDVRRLKRTRAFDKAAAEKKCVLISC